MTLLTRLRAFKAVSREPIHKWRLEVARCPLCGPSLFLALSPEPIQIRCLRCRESTINLATVEVIKKLDVSNAYELSTYGATYKYGRSNFKSFVSSEYFPGLKPGEIVDGIRNEDVQQLSFPNGSFDLITSNQVFEHVPDYALAFRECLRCLMPGGLLVFTVPMHFAPCTIKNAELRDGNIVWLGAPEWHGSRLRGPNSAPVFWRFSVHDIISHVLGAGFSRAELVEVFMCRSQKLPQHVIRATK